MLKFNKEAGQVSRLLLVLAVIVFVAIIIVFLVMRMAQKPSAPAEVVIETVPLPVYEKQLGAIRFVFESALNKGKVLKASEVVNNLYSSSQKDLTTGEKFIKVTIGAQNKGTENTLQNAWDMGDIIDSEGRRFVAVEDYNINPWLPNPDLCGVLLKPAFDPTPCTKIYEVSKSSTGLKIEVKTGIDNLPNNLSSGKAEIFLIDLIIK